MTNYTAMAQEVEAKTTDLVARSQQQHIRYGATKGYLAAMEDVLDWLVTDDSLGAIAKDQVHARITNMAMRLPKRIDEVVS